MTRKLQARGRRAGSGTICTWPHQWMTPETEERLTRLIARHRPFIVHIARRMAGEDSFLADELEQAGLMLLWEFGVDELESQGRRYIRQAIVLRMRATRRAERRADGLGDDEEAA